MTVHGGIHGEYVENVQDNVEISESQCLLAIRWKGRVSHFFMTSREIKKRFYKLKKSRAYCELGNMFWNIFMLQRQDAARKTAQGLWRSLSVIERGKCEG